MSIFDTDLVERPVHIPKENAIEYSLNWTLQRAKTYLSEYLKSKKRNSAALAFCQEYLRVRCDDLLRSIWWKGGAIDSTIEHPEECWEYPSVRSYQVKVDYAVVQTYLFVIYINYRVGTDLTYKYYKAHVDL